MRKGESLLAEAVGVALGPEADVVDSAAEADVVEVYIMTRVSMGAHIGNCPRDYGATCAVVIIMLTRVPTRKAFNASSTLWLLTDRIRPSLR